MREKTIYEKIAEKYNTTPEEVRREMQIAIDAGFDNPDPALQEELKKMTLKGERPTPEEVINYAVKKLKGKYKYEEKDNCIDFRSSDLDNCCRKYLWEI